MNQEKVKCPNCGAPFVNRKDLDLHFVEVHKQSGKKPDEEDAKFRVGK